MEKPTTVSDPEVPISDVPPRAQGLSLGTLHSFVEISELRRILGELTTAEMLRMLVGELAEGSATEP